MAVLYLITFFNLSQDMGLDSRLAYSTSTFLLLCIICYFAFSSVRLTPLREEFPRFYKLTPDFVELTMLFHFEWSCELLIINAVRGPGLAPVGNTFRVSSPSKTGQMGHRHGTE